MGDFWSGTTKYDENASKRKARDIANAATRQADRNSRSEQSITGQQGNILSGSEAEQEGQIAGLNVGNLGYGQGLGQTGSDIQRVKDLQRSMTDNTAGNPVTAAIMSQKAGAEANAKRQLQAGGVKGGAAVGAVEAVSRQRQSDIDASLYGQQRQAIQDERSLASNMLSGQTSLMQGERAANITAPATPKASGLMDSVICTELHDQGIMPTELYLKDSEYGRILQNTCPDIIVGYHSWAKPTVKLMKKSKLFTKIISYPAMKWAKHIAGEESSAVGYVCQNIGEPLCNIIGKCIKLSYGVVYGV